MKKKYILPGVLIVAIVISWAVFGADSNSKAVILISPQQGDFIVDVTTTGELRAQKSTDILGPRGMREVGVHRAEITSIVPEGTIVEKGDFVAELDRAEITTQLQNALLELDQMNAQVIQVRIDTSLTLSQARNDIINLRYGMEEAQLKREQSKYESPAVQRQIEIDFEQAKRHYEQAQEAYKKKVTKAEAQLREIETELTEEKNEVQKIRQLMDKFTVLAPEAGMVIYKRDRGGRKQTVGSTINAWNPVVAELPDFSVMESVTYVNEVDIQQVEVGQHVNVSLDALPEKKLTGIVTSVSNVGTQRPASSAKVYEVIIEIQESDNVLRPSMTTSNIIHIQSFAGAIYLPLETVHTQDSLNFVYVNDGGPVMNQVILGAMNGNYVVVREGIKASNDVYLSMPADTSGIKKDYLPEELVQKYKDEVKAKEAQTASKNNTNTLKKGTNRKFQMPQKLNTATKVVINKNN